MLEASAQNHVVDARSTVISNMMEGGHCTGGASHSLSNMPGADKGGRHSACGCRPLGRQGGGAELCAGR